MTDIPNKKELM